MRISEAAKMLKPNQCLEIRKVFEQGWATSVRIKDYGSQVKAARATLFKNDITEADIKRLLLELKNANI